jgi:hypothetical protein
MNLKRSSWNAYVHSSSHTYDHCYDLAKTFQFFIITFDFLLCLFIVCAAGRNIETKRQIQREGKHHTRTDSAGMCV